MNDWENPERVAENRLKAHVNLLPYPDEETAESAERGSSPWFKLLNGVWDFHLADSPSSVQRVSLGMNLILKTGVKLQCRPTGS